MSGGGDDSEEKTLDASQRKLRKAREKGQVVTSQETVMSVAGITALLFLYSRRLDITEKLQALWVLEPVEDGQPFAILFQDKLTIVTDLAVQLVLPLLGVVIAMSVLTGVAISGGPVFSTEPVAPKFEKISPVEGVKRMFGLKALKKFGMHVLRLAILLGVFGLVLLQAWGVLLRAPICGLGCVSETLYGVVLPMVIAAVAVMTVFAVFDFLVNRSAFMKDQKMSMTEMKREMKDMMGDPHLNAFMRQTRHEMVSGPTVGPSHAMVVVAAGSKGAIGIRYVEGDTPAPVLVHRTRSVDGARAMLKASGGLHVVDHATFALLETVQIGGYITTDKAIQALVPMLQRAINR